MVSARRDVFEANQYMMALTHVGEAMGEYIASIVDSTIQTSLSNSGVSGVSTLAGGSLSTYEKIGADSFMSQAASKIKATGNSLNITDEAALKIYVGDAAAYEGDATPTAVVYLNHAHTEDVTLNYTISAEQGNNATAGADFTAKSGTVTILAGSTTVTIDLPIKTDNTVEASETFSLKLTGTSAGTIVAPTATITLHDSSKTIDTDGELKSLSELLVDKATSEVGSALTAAYNTYATSNSASWSISNSVATMQPTLLRLG